MVYALSQLASPGKMYFILKMLSDYAIIGMSMMNEEMNFGTILPFFYS
ncbi:hypothetical protein [Lysinibacillus composti]|nr:hypothetical protein [Lysinibacillus composti]